MLPLWINRWWNIYAQLRFNFIILVLYSSRSVTCGLRAPKIRLLAPWATDILPQWMLHRCCEQVLFTTRFDKNANSNKKRHRTKSLWYICSKWQKGERGERFLWDNMYVKQQGNDLMINPWCNEQQNAQMLQDELKCKQVCARTCKTGYEARLMGSLISGSLISELKEAYQRASRVKARRAKYREVQDWQEITKRWLQANTN